MFGSDFPNSDQWGTYETVMSLVRSYFMAKGRAVAEKYFWKNSIPAYRWVKREAGSAAGVSGSRIEKSDGRHKINRLPFRPMVAPGW